MRSPKATFPLGAAIVVLAVAGSAVALSSPSLPSVAPAQLLSSVIRAVHNPVSVSGDVLSHVNLGLPDVGGFHHAVSPTEIVSGDHAVRIWISPDGFRVDDLLPLAERSLRISKTDAWAYDSERFTAWHLSLPAASGMQHENPVPTPDPIEMARRALNAIDPSTLVSVAETTSVAGRDAYVLRLVPRSATTLVGRIDISIDAEHRLPLRIAIFSKGASTPAISVGFRSIDFGAIRSSVFAFAPPKDANVKTQGFGKSEAGPGAGPTTKNEPARSSTAAGRRPQTFGSGWDSIVAIPVPEQSAGSERPAISLKQFLPYSGPLFSARLVDHAGRSWIVLGMVPQASLIAVEQQLA